MKKVIFIIVISIFFINIKPINAANNTYLIVFDSGEFKIEEGRDYIISEGNLFVSPYYITSVVPFSIPGKGIWWDSEAKTLTLAYLDEEEYIKPRVVFKVGESYFNDFEKQISIETKVKVVEGRVYLPIRAISKAYGKEVTWINKKEHRIIRIKD